VCWGNLSHEAPALLLLNQQATTVRKLIQQKKLTTNISLQLATVALVRLNLFSISSVSTQY
jgi:hypothetical protein